MERDQQALTGNPAKDRDYLHSCAGQPGWLPEAQQEGLQTPQPRAVCGEQGGTELPRHHSFLQHRHLPTAVLAMPNILQASKEINNLPASKPNELTCGICKQPQQGKRL